MWGSAREKAFGPVLILLTDDLFRIWFGEKIDASPRRIFGTGCDLLQALLDLVWVVHRGGHILRASTGC